MSQPKILVIDDDPSDVHLLQIALRGQNCEFEIEIAVDGELAIRVIAEHCGEKKLPCVVVLDMHLPKIDGMEVLEAIRNTPDLDHVKVIVTTSSIGRSYQAAIQSMRAHYYPKPENLEEFESLAGYILTVCRTFIQDHVPQIPQQ